jgi:hypothetical protein
MEVHCTVESWGREKITQRRGVARRIRGRILLRGKREKERERDSQEWLPRGI